MATFNNAKNVEFIINFDDMKKAVRVLDDTTLKRLGSLGKYYTILHDEFSANEKDEETIHRHLVLESVEGNSSHTYIAVVSNIFDVPKNCVQTMVVKNMSRRVRYLCHMDDKDKYQFEHDRVQTNDAKGYRKYKELKPVPDVEVLASYRGDLYAFGKDYGPAMAKQYRTLIQDFKNEFVSEQMIKSEKLIVEALFKQWGDFEYYMEKAVEPITSLCKKVKVDEHRHLAYASLDWLKKAMQVLKDIKQNGVINQ